MKTVRRFVAASLIAAAALAPLAAHAHDCEGDDEGEHEHEGRREGLRRPPPPGYEIDPSPVFQPGWRPGPGGWREGWGWDDRGWVRRDDGARDVEAQRLARLVEIRDLRFELRRLDGDRTAFLWRWGWSPRKVARYDAWFLPRRAELQERLDRLTFYGWR